MENGRNSGWALWCFFVQLPLFLWDFSWYKLFHIEYKYTNAVICIIQYSEQT